MRQIKFRAWHKWRKEMEKITDFYWFEENHFRSVFDSNEYELMQYTGLKDKNGVEIYEGDILNVFDWGANEGDLLGVTAVVFCPDEHGWRYESCVLGVEDFYDQFRNVEVIGNIHEHPELLVGTE